MKRFKLMARFAGVAVLVVLAFAREADGRDNPLRLGVAGLTHTHVHWVFGSARRGDIEIVGIAEPDTELAQRYADQYEFPMERVFSSTEELLEKSDPEAVAAFGTIFEHLEVVQKAAPRGVHVMVEKPLAVNMDHATQMRDLAEKHNIHLLTNYETTWYPTTHRAYQLAKEENAIGGIRKILVNDGHKGPKKIGINDEFLNWLTDPVQNGGGAEVDFGCYGANLLTWLMDGARPRSVTAVSMQLQPENNPEVNDESVIVLQYANAVAVIQGSWNWPIGRKDMEIYGLDGVIYADNRHDLRIRLSQGYDGFSEEVLKLEEREAPFDDPFAHLAAVVRGELQLGPDDLSGLNNNLTVVEILDAARKSAKLGETVYLE